MKVIAKKNRELALINAQNTQNENRAETITLVVPEEYEDFNKKIVFITSDGNVWDVITNNEYKITNAITKYDKVDFYIWLTKEVDGESIDFRTKTKTLSFYHNEDASDEITDEEIHGVNTVVNLLEEEIEKVENLNIEATKIGDTTTVTITKKDGTTESVEINDGVDGQDGQDGYTPQKGIDYFTEQDIEEIEGDILNEVYTKSETDTLLQEKADVEDIPDVSSFITKDVNNLTNYTLKTNTGSLIDLEINDTTYVVTLKLKNQDGTIISTDTIDLPLESVVVSGRYDNTTKKVILTLENGSEVDFSVADLVAGLQTEITSLNKLASDLVDDTNSGNKFVTTSEKQTWNNKLDESDLTDYVKNTDYASSNKGGVIRPTDYYGVNISSNGRIMGIDDTYTRYNSYYPREAFISKGMLENVITGKQLINQTQLEESQETQDEQIKKLKATLPTTTGEGQDITLDKTAEMEFVKPPLPMGNSEQESTTGKNLINTSNCVGGSLNGDGIHLDAGYSYFNITDNKVTVTTTQMYRGFVSDYIECKPNTRYKLSYKTEQTGLSFENYYSFYDENKANGTRNQTGLSTAGAKYMRVSGTLSTATTADFYNIQLEEGSTATSYEPYTNGASPNPDYPQEITNVTGDVEVVVQNKNLAKINSTIKTAGGTDLSQYNVSYTVDEDGTITLNGTANNGNVFVLGDLDLKPDTYMFEYIYVSGSVSSYVPTTIRDGSNNALKELSGNTVNDNKSLVNSVDGKSLTIYVSNGKVFTNFKFKIQIEKGSTATNYVKHKEQKFIFPLGNEKLMLGDYLADDGIHHVRKQTELTEDNIDLVYNKTSQYGVNCANIRKDALGYKTAWGSRYCLINKYSEISTVQEVRSGTFGTVFDQIYLRIFDDRFTDKETAKQLLIGTIIEILLAEEEITPYTAEQQEVYNQIKQALSYNEQTNISSNQNALFSVEAYQSTKLVLEEMATAIVALGGV